MSGNIRWREGYADHEINLRYVTLLNLRQPPIVQNGQLDICTC